MLVQIDPDKILDYFPVEICLLAVYPTLHSLFSYAMLAKPDLKKIF